MMNTREIVTKYFEYVNAGQWDRYLELFDEHVIMDEQITGHLEGIQEVRKGIEGLKKAPKFQNHLIDMVVEDNFAMARWHIEAILAPDINIDVKGVNYFEIKDGKIVRFANYHDTAPFSPILKNK